MKSEDRSSYPGRIENQPFTMERTSSHNNPTNEDKEKLESNKIEQNEAEDYAAEDNEEYAGR